MIWVPFWWSRGIGGRSAVDYLMRVRDMTFIEAMERTTYVGKSSLNAFDAYTAP